MIRSPEAAADFAPQIAPRATPAARTLLHGALFLTILVSPLVFFEPSPYEVVFALFAVSCIVASVKFDRKILPLALLLLVLNASGAVTLLPILDDSRVLTYAATSLYLGIMAVIFACVFAEDSLRRIEIVRHAYVIAAAFACLIGIGGYFGVFPGVDFVLENSRVRATFKDPNVFGPFLILPLLFVIQSLFFRGLRLGSLFLFGLLAFGLLLSFSRGAWGHFVFSAAILVVLTFLTAPDLRTRTRLILLSLISVAALAGLLTVALSFDAVGGLFKERAKLTQSYDVGSGGRFDLQGKAVDAMLENPAGMGPYQFARSYGGQQHNVYQQAFLVYGWAGGFAYVTLVFLTLAIGLRLCFVPTSWQPYLIAAWATFAGAAGEGLIIDTDHWRHFYILLGMIWGLSAASINTASQYRQQLP